MKKEYVNELDLLRFLAALSVTLFHLAHRSASVYGTSALPFQPLAGIADYGYMGVDLFFMISGFVVMGSAQNATVGSFVMGRITRLYPAFFFCCTVAFTVLLAFGQPPVPTVGTYLANMTMQPHFFSAVWLDPTYWTLALEIRFYFLLTLLVLFKQVHNAERWSYAWLGAIFMLMIFPVERLHSKLLVPFAPYFVAGITFHYLRMHGTSTARLATLLICYILSLYDAVAMIKGQPLYANLSYVVACLATTGFYAAFYLIATRKTGRLGQYRWATLGLLTYPLYLIHQPVCTIMLSTFAPAINQQVVLWGSLIVALLVAYLIHIYVERPLAAAMRNLVPTVRQLLARQPAG